MIDESHEGADTDKAAAVGAFLDLICGGEKFPFGAAHRDELAHTFWIFSRVDSAKAMKKRLQSHEIFKDYHIILATGKGDDDVSGGLDDAEISHQNSTLDQAKKAVKKYPRTITLSVGQLTTGVTVPQWSAVLMCSNIRSLALYAQAAFRAQNPYEFARSDGSMWRKVRAFVFDFDPTRALGMAAQLASKSDAKGGSKAALVVAMAAKPAAVKLIKNREKSR